MVDISRKTSKANATQIAILSICNIIAIVNMSLICNWRKFILNGRCFAGIAMELTSIDISLSQPDSNVTRQESHLKVLFKKVFHHFKL